ncbi:MAG: alpha/beta fold hydrolase [Stellaceae bacterium]
MPASTEIRPDRRLAPRPLPAHLASAIMLWQTSRAALKESSSAWPLWSGGDASRWRSLAAEIAQSGPDAVAAALDGEVSRSARRFLDGLEAYRRHPYRRAAERALVRWQEGSTRLLDYGTGGGPVVLVIPSLINRFYVLDLLPRQSFLGHLAAAGLRPLVIDWGAPGPDERGFGLSDYIAGRLDAALTAARALAPGPVGIAGYCIGGLLALALALRRPAETAALMLLATPWDFHAERRAEAQFLGRAAGLAAASGEALPVEALPVEAIQTLFFALDPLLAERKFRRFAEFDAESAAARMFVALEDWINDGVPLAAGVARECFGGWYGANDPSHGSWRIAGQAVIPEELNRPVLVVLPARDRIVPPASAAPLAAALPAAAVLRPPLGHIGMMAGETAPQTLWPALTEWLSANISAA